MSMFLPGVGLLGSSDPFNWNRQVWSVCGRSTCYTHQVLPYISLGEIITSNLVVLSNYQLDDCRGSNLLNLQIALHIIKIWLLLRILI